MMSEQNVPTRLDIEKMLDSVKVRTDFKAIEKMPEKAKERNRIKRDFIKQRLTETHDVGVAEKVVSDLESYPNYEKPKQPAFREV